MVGKSNRTQQDSPDPHKRTIKRSQIFLLQTNINNRDERGSPPAVFAFQAQKDTSRQPFSSHYWQDHSHSAQSNQDTLLAPPTSFSKDLSQMMIPFSTLTFLVFVASVERASAFTTAVTCLIASDQPLLHQRITTTTLSAKHVDRRTAFTAVASFAVVAFHANAAHALNSVPADNEIVKEQRTVVNKLDINNAPVADYMQFPGLYPTIGGKIANNGPFQKVKDVYKLDILNAAEKAKIKEYESELTATASTGLDVMRGRDPYRRTFNK